MRRIVFADPHLLGEAVGGTEVQLWLLADAFRKAGWETHYITNAKTREQARDGVRIHPIAPGLNVNQFQSIQKCLAKIQPTVIYQRGRKDYTSIVGDFAAKTGTSFIFSAASDTDCFRYKETYRLKERYGLKHFVRQLPRALRQDIATLKGLRTATHVLTQTVHQQRNMLARLGLSSVVIPNMHQLTNIENPAKETPPVVLWLATLKRWKRPELFLEMVDRLQGLNCRFVLAGKMSEEKVYGGPVKSYQDKYTNFEYLPDVDFEESNRLIASATVFVSTSPAEGFPNTFIQAWLRKTPTVSMGVDPDDMIVRYGLGGVASDPQSLAERVLEIVRDGELGRSIGDKAQQVARDKFGLENNFSKLENLARPHPSR